MFMPAFGGFSKKKNIPKKIGMQLTDAHCAVKCPQNYQTSHQA